MNALGISTDQTRETFVALRDEEVESLRSLREHTEYEALDAETAALARYTYDAWLSDVQTASTSETWEEREASRTPYGLMRREWAENTDPRFVLRAYLDAVDPGETVMLDASDLLDGGWIEDGIDPHAVAANHYQSYLLHGLPAIVITEGRSDVEVLEAAISILRPHLRGYINFLDFSFNNEGGAAAAVKTLRALSAAGVANRVVLLLDNDTAGHEAVRNLRTTVLPSQYLIAHYPDLPLAQAYPTLGPTGPATMDVNGLAGSIEMYLGRDCLEDTAGDLFPVQWTGRVESMNAYQGELSRKSAAQEAFKIKVRKTMAAGGILDPEDDWTALEAIVDSLLGLLSSSADG